MKMPSLDGKTVLLTGASRGIGAAAAREFVAAGANVALLARSADAIAGLAADLGPQAMAVTADVSDFGAMEGAVAAATDRFGGVDILVGNAGVVDPVGHLETLDPDAFGKTIDINLKGVFYGMKAVLPGMLDRGAGTIITVSSGAAHNAVEGWSAYCASKAGAYMLTRMADKEYRHRGLRVLGLSPGTVATDMQRRIKATGINPVSQLEWSAHIPPEWPAKTLVWMCGAEADHHLGQDVSLREDTIRRAVGLI